MDNIVYLSSEIILYWEQILLFTLACETIDDFLKCKIIAQLTLICLYCRELRNNSIEEIKRDAFLFLPNLKEV